MKFLLCYGIAMLILLLYAVDSMAAQPKADMKELEDRLTAKLQRALDNPLADSEAQCLMLLKA